jgi:hypothetical protein
MGGVAVQKAGFSADNCTSEGLVPALCEARRADNCSVDPEAFASVVETVCEAARHVAWGLAAFSNSILGLHGLLPGTHQRTRSDTAIPQPLCQWGRPSCYRRAYRQCLCHKLDCCHGAKQRGKALISPGSKTEVREGENTV